MRLLECGKAEYYFSNDLLVILKCNAIAAERSASVVKIHSATQHTISMSSYWSVKYSN